MIIPTVTLWRDNERAIVNRGSVEETNLRQQGYTDQRGEPSPPADAPVPTGTRKRKPRTE
jgi:hypothetical protein